MSLVLIVRMSRNTFDLNIVKISTFAQVGKLKINNQKLSCQIQTYSKSPIMPNYFQKPLHISSITHQDKSKTLSKELQKQLHAFQETLHSHACAHTSGLPMKLQTCWRLFVHYIFVITLSIYLSLCSCLLRLSWGKKKKTTTKQQKTNMQEKINL